MSSWFSDTGGLLPSPSHEAVAFLCRFTLCQFMSMEEDGSQNSVFFQEDSSANGLRSSIWTKQVGNTTHPLLIFLFTRHTETILQVIDSTNIFVLFLSGSSC